jgi:LmbE family N-acetylglucosaminyl deacetylase
MMNWIFLSPHFDDIALSCGGLVWEQSTAGDAISIWTICAGKPPNRPLSAYAQLHHERWATGALAVEQRRNEDIASCAVMRAAYRHLDIPDCIYRPRQRKIPHYYTSGMDIFGSIHPAEKKNLVRRLARIFIKDIPPDAQVVCPLTLGNHVDHQITRLAAERAAKALRLSLLYYADYPYAVQQPEQIAILRQKGWQDVQFRISQEGFEAWLGAIAAHQSQISTFWLDRESLQKDIRAYMQGQNGLCLWKPA